MKKKYTAILVVLLLAAALIFSGCSNVFSPSPPPAPGKGTVTVAFSAGVSARTLSPSALDFDLYEFSFIKNNAVVAGPFEKPKENDFSFTLDAGPGYTLEVKAFKVDGESKVLAAEGVSAVFEVKASTTVNVKLSGKMNAGAGEAGTFSYAVQFPETASVERFALLIDDGEDYETVIEYNLLDAPYSAGVVVASGAGVTTISHSVDLPAGWYVLEIVLSDGSKYADDGDIVPIYSNVTTPYEKTFAVHDFKVDPTKPVAVTEWNGFRIITEADDAIELYTESFNPQEGTLYSRYYAGNKAFQYGVFTDPSGNKWNDVLEVIPPEGGYDDGVALLYEMPEEGVYTFHMKVWLQSGKTGDIHWQYLGGDQNILQSPTYTKGQWVTLTEKITHSFGNNTYYPDFSCIYLNGNNGNNGLQEAALYIRDVYVTKDSVVLDASFLNEELTEPEEPLPAGALWLSHTGTITLAKGSMRRITANQDVSWHSSNPAVATAEQEPNYSGDIGLVVGMSPGTATVTVTGESESIVLNVVVEGDPPAGKKYIALTFDDGPGGDTAAVLDAFQDLGAHATFFVIGGNIGTGNYHLLKRMRDEGHDIGNHTTSHSMSLYTWNYSSIKSDIDNNQSTIAAATSDDPVTPVYIRAPALYHSEAFSRAAGDTGLSFMGGELTYDSGGRDGDAPFGHNHDSTGGFSKANLVWETLAHARPWGIIINHDNGESGGNMAAAMREAIPALRDLGYEVVSLSEMVAARRALGLVPGAIYDDFGAVPEDPNYDLLANKVTSVAVTPSSVSLLPGQTKQLVANVLPVSAADRSVSWVSSNPSAATVDSFGKVTAVALGNATITATTNNTNTGGNHLSASATIEVVLELSDYWHGFFIPGRPENFSNASWVKYGSVTVPGDTAAYGDVLKLMPPSGGYQLLGTYAALPLHYVFPDPGNYSISMKMWVEASGSQADISWINLFEDYLFIDMRNVARGAWIDVSGSVSYSGGNNAIDLTGLGFGGSVGLRDATVYIRDLVIKKDGVVFDQSTPNEEVTGPEDPTEYWHGFNIPGRPENYSGAKGVDHESITIGGGTYSDVLEIVPPSGGYQVLPSGWAATTFYRELEPGTYTLSMRVLLQSSSQTDFIVSSIDDKTFFDKSDIALNQWHSFGPATVAIDVNEYGCGIYILGDTSTQWAWAGRGLNDAKIFIRDVILKKGETVIAESALNEPYIQEPEPPEPEGNPLTEWNGLKVITPENSGSVMLGGVSRYDRYYSGAAATQFDSLQVPGDSVTYNDVLKLEPPAGGYQKGIALIYDLDGEAEYTVSMKMWVVGGQSGGITWQYLGDDRNLTGLETNQVNTWVSLSETFVYSYADNDAVFPGEIGFIYLLGKSGASGLDNITIYIRDVVVTRNGTVIDVSTPNP